MGDDDEKGDGSKYGGDYRNCQNEMWKEEQQLGFWQKTQANR